MRTNPTTYDERLLTKADVRALVRALRARRRNREAAELRARFAPFCSAVPGTALADLPTESIRVVLAVALVYAMRHRGGFIGTEHLLLGLIAEPRGRAKAVLKKCGVPLARLRAALLASVFRCRYEIPRGMRGIPLNPVACMSLAAAVRDAASRAEPVDGLHLLLALSERRGHGGDILGDAGVTPDSLRRNMIADV